MRFHTADERPFPVTAGEEPMDPPVAPERQREPREQPLRPLSPLGGGDWIEGDYVAARIWTE